MSEKIYLVTRGDYSDYHVVAAFSTHEKAAVFRNLLAKDGQVEEIELDPKTSDLAARGYRIWRVLMLRDGAVKYVADEDPSASVPTDGRTSIHSMAYACRDAHGGRRPALDAHVWATDREHAVKIVNEKRAQLIAAGGWEL